MTAPTPDLERRGLRLEYLTVAWNVIEAVVAVASGLAAKSIALVGFGLDSTVEIFAACVVIWQLRGVREEREQRALRLIALSFYALAAYVGVQATRDLVIGAQAGESVVGIGLATASLIAMPVLGVAKRRTGQRLDNPTLVADCRDAALRLPLGRPPRRPGPQRHPGLVLGRPHRRPRHRRPRRARGSGGLGRGGGTRAWRRGLNQAVRA
jgi:hypothetical protein